MSGAPTRILLAAPVRDRAWILPAYLEHLAALAVPEGVELDCFFLVNGPDADGCRDMLERFRQSVAPSLPVAVEYWPEEPPVPPTRETQNRSRIFAYLARLRNALVVATLRGGYDYLLSVDSDILLRPDTLAHLLAARRDVVSAVVINEEFWDLPPSFRHCNLLVRADYPGPDGGTGYHHLDHLPAQGLVEVDITGACFLIRREVLEAGCRFADHAMGEDVPFCQQAQEAGFHLWADCGQRLPHMMAAHTWCPPEVLARQCAPEPHVIFLHAGDERRVEMVYGREAIHQCMARIWAHLFRDDAARMSRGVIPEDAQVATFQWEPAAGGLRLQLVAKEAETSGVRSVAAPETLQGSGGRRRAKARSTGQGVVARSKRR